jgi:DNA-binding transcriptional LysR family regulator
MKDQKALPAGLVRYAMPESCQWTPHYRQIMAQMKQFPQIRFEISILPNSAIVDKLGKAEIDFGFIAGEKVSSDLRFEKFSDEHYSAVAFDKKLFQPFKDSSFENLRWISYPGWEDFFMSWAKAHDLWKDLKSQVSKPTVSIGTLAGAIHAAQEGAGIAIIPTHCVSEELDQGTLYAYNASKGKEALQPIYLARRLGEQLPKRVQLVMDMLREAKVRLG